MISSAMLPNVALRIPPTRGPVSDPSRSVDDQPSLVGESCQTERLDEIRGVRSSQHGCLAARALDVRAAQGARLAPRHAIRRLHAMAGQRADGHGRGDVLAVAVRLRTHRSSTSWQSARLQTRTFSVRPFNSRNS